MPQDLKTKKLSTQLDQYKELVTNFASQFPALKHNPDLIYLDNAATSLRPQAVLDAFSTYYAYPGNVERSLLTKELSQVINQGHQALSNYIDPKNNNKDSLVFTQNTTDALNLLALTLGQFWAKQAQHLETSLKRTKQKFYILVNESNHHANLLPWIKLCANFDFLELITIPLNKDLSFDFKCFEMLCTLHGDHILLMSFSTVDNINGYTLPIKRIAQIQKQLAPKAWLCLDNAQGSCFNAHYLQENLLENWPADFVIGSLHKMYGLTGLGYLMVSERVLKLTTMQNFGLSAQATAIDNYLAQYLETGNLDYPPSPPPSKTKVENNEVYTDLESSTKKTKKRKKPTKLELFEQSLQYQINHLNDFNQLHFLEHQWVGGGFVKNVSLKEANYSLHDNNPFTVAGTSNINALTTVKTNIEWLKEQPLEELYHYTNLLQQYFIAKLLTLDNVSDLRYNQDIARTLYRTAKPIRILPSYGHHVLLTIEDSGDVELGQFLAKHQVAVRVGKHCVYPFHRTIDVDSTIRFSLAPFNNKEQIDKVIELIKEFSEDFF
ncbi:aminotransferase class V-fold PLP-dependent enzyme [Psittacicella hinzii]|uniref:Aminotransferase class V domain-containing protein n=1 Tax=Psittacicella hinzii TaxID=2028575 RepID=A0A3A1YBL8_9GAMM|nr:aminotransferase class V-fold PLP-dependent enzyme [Psittacicella hinzii]RIY34609.1 hypothetical protein CKF58_08045 [Psittacicella hinzii]